MCLSKKAQGAPVLDVSLKRKLRAGKQADSNLGFADGGEAAGDRFRKIRRYQFIPDLSGPRGNEMKTVIAHWGLLCRNSHSLLNKPSLIVVIDLDQLQELPQQDERHGTLGAASLRSGAHRSPEPAVFFYASDDQEVGNEVSAD
jgi:hypothetical protein